MWLLTTTFGELSIQLLFKGLIEKNKEREDEMENTEIHIHFVVLLEHPEFRAGMSDARERFLEEYEPAPLTLDQMINEVEISIGRCPTEQNKVISDCPSYIYWLGYVYGTINEGLIYAESHAKTRM